MVEPATFHLDWAQMRREWESTPISTRALAKRWGLASDNTIRRRMKKEGWVKDPDAVATLAVEGEAGEAGEDEAAPAGPDEPVEEAAEPPREAVRGGVRGDAHREVRTPEPVAETQERRAIAQSSVRTERANSGSAGQSAGISHGSDGRLTPSDDLAAARAKATRRQMRMAYDMLETVELILEHIRAIQSANFDDQDSMDRANTARAALQALNPEKETMAGQMKAATDMQASAFKMLRQALAMDYEAAAQEPPSIPGGRVGPGGFESILSRMPLDMKLKMREIALALKQERDQESIIIEGSAA